MLCESCNEQEATTKSTNPDWSGYALCDECAAEYDARPPVGIVQPMRERIMICPHCGSPCAPGTVYRDNQDKAYRSQEWQCGLPEHSPESACGQTWRVQTNGACTGAGIDQICTYGVHHDGLNPEPCIPMEEEVN